MTDVLPLRETWRDRIQVAGLNLVQLAGATETPMWTVYSYARKINGRRPPDAWLARVERVLDDYRLAWTCKSCGTRNPGNRFGCLSCARSYDGYSPSALPRRPW